MSDAAADIFDSESEPVHLWFGLTYANYLTLPRTLLQSMPTEWQRRFVRCLVELDRAFDGLPMAPAYTVSTRDRAGKFITDPVPHYNRGRTRIAPKSSAAAVATRSEP